MPKLDASSLFIEEDALVLCHGSWNGVAAMATLGTIATIAAFRGKSHAMAGFPTAMTADKDVVIAMLWAIPLPWQDFALWWQGVLCTPAAAAALTSSAYTR